MTQATSGARSWDGVASAISGDKADVFLNGVVLLRDTAIQLNEADYDLSSFLSDSIASYIKNGRAHELVSFAKRIRSIRLTQTYLVKEPLLHILTSFLDLPDDEASAMLSIPRSSEGYSSKVLEHRSASKETTDRPFFGQCTVRTPNTMRNNDFFVKYKYKNPIPTNVRLARSVFLLQKPVRALLGCHPSSFGINVVLTSVTLSSVTSGAPASSRLTVRRKLRLPV